MICPLILNCNPHKSHLPSFPDSAGLTGVLAFLKFARLWSSRHLLKFRAQTGSVGCVARDKNVTGCLRNALGAGRGLSPFSHFCIVVRLLLAGNCSTILCKSSLLTRKMLVVYSYVNVILHERLACYNI